MVTVTIYPPCEGNFVPAVVRSTFDVNQVRLNRLKIATAETEVAVEVQILEFLLELRKLLYNRRSVSSRMTFSGEMFIADFYANKVVLDLHDVEVGALKSISLSSDELTDLYRKVLAYFDQIVITGGQSPHLLSGRNDLDL